MPYRVDIGVVELEVDPRVVLAYIRQEGRVSQLQLMERFQVSDWAIHDVLAILELKWKIYRKPYAIRLGKSKVPQVFIVPRNKPRQRKYADTIHTKNLRRKQLRDNGGKKSQGQTKGLTPIGKVDIKER